MLNVDMSKAMHNNLTGCPSTVFHRCQIEEETLIHAFGIFDFKVVCGYRLTYLIQTFRIIVFGIYIVCLARNCSHTVIST